MFSKGKYILIQSLLILLSPIVSFVVAIKFYKQGISQIFMIIFAFYFGMHFYIGDDLTNHYINMRMFYSGKSWNEIISNPLVFGIGHDYYHILMKYLISRFTNSKIIFAGINALIYAAIFINFFREFRYYYKNFMPVMCGILLLCVIFTVQFYWYGGVRFWFGAFFFAGFYLRYLNTEKRRYLLISFLCVLFHFSLITLPLVWIANWALSKLWVGVRVILLTISLLFRFIHFDFVPLLVKYVPGAEVMGLSRIDQRIHEDLLRYNAEIRNSGNMVYLHRNEVLLFFLGILLLLFWSRKVTVTKKNMSIFFYSLTIFTLVNFGYTELIFYDRFLKMCVLLIYTFLFMVSYENYEKLKGVSLIIMMISAVPMLFAILTPLVEMRRHLYSPELLFGNFFIDWTGGISSVHGKWYND